MKGSKMKKKLALGLIAILSAALVWVLFVWSPADAPSQKHTNMGLASTPVGGDFTVEIQNGDLSLKDLRGKVVVLYFGYTQCPDICPTSLALLTQALNEMSEKELADVQAIFVSVDPERDNVTRLEEYAAYFHPNIIGATAEKDVIDKITKLYGASYRIVDSNSAMGYIVDHSSYTYIIDKKGKLRKTLVHGTNPKKVLEEIRKLLAE
jgi:protein SCO1/2